MTLHDHRGRFERRLSPFIEWCEARDINPNALTVVALVATSLAGLAFLFSSPDRWWLLAVGSLLLMVGAVLDSADGLLARATGRASDLGDYLDHALDRFADAALLLGFTFSPWVPLELGLFAIVGTLLTSYMGTQAQAVGVGRDYGGLVGRADRMFVLFWGALAQIGLTLAGVDPAASLSSVAVLDWVGQAVRWNLVGLAVGWIALAGNITALQRFWAAYQDLDEDHETSK